MGIVDFVKGGVQRMMIARADEHKDKVVVSVVFRGRELAHIDEGKKVMDRVVQELLAVGKLESPPMNQGKRMICTLMPKQGEW